VVVRRNPEEMGVDVYERLEDVEQGHPRFDGQ
jgi:hypothetical protein